MKSLAELMGSPASPLEVPVDDFLSRYGLARNPFPASRTIIPQVLFNQEPALAKFAGNVKELLDGEPQRRAMGITGGTGGGKTHFLRHCQYLLESYIRQTRRSFVIVEFPAGAGSVAQLLRELLRRADEECKVLGELDLLTAIVRKVQELGEDIETVGQPDLRSVLALLIRADQPGFEPPDRDKQLTFDPVREISKKWLAGGTLTQTERKYLGVFSRLGSASMMTRVLTELLELARRLRILEGLFLCIDETETIFIGGLSTARVQGFLQDLRYFFDEAVRGGKGYSLFVLTASTQTGSTNLLHFNYPLYQRLGLEGDGRIELQPISSIEEARAFAAVYIDHEHKRTQELRPELNGDPIRTTRSVLTNAEIESAYVSAASGSSALTRAVGRVNQAQFLEALHLLVEKKRQSETGV